MHTAAGTDIRGSYIFCLVFLSLYLGGSAIVPSGDSLFSQVRQQTVSEEQTGTDHAIQGMHLVCGKFSEKRICVGKCFSGKPGGYTKEEPRRLQCGIYLARKFPQYNKISTQNKLNFIDGIMTEISECLVYGLYVLFNSTIYDEYYRILNGSTQVNSTEVNNMPVPELETIQEMGRKLIKIGDFSEKSCNLILEEYYG